MGANQGKEKQDPNQPNEHQLAYYEQHLIGGQQEQQIQEFDQQVQFQLEDIQQIQSMDIQQQSKPKQMMQTQTTKGSTKPKVYYNKMPYGMNFKSYGVSGIETSQLRVQHPKTDLFWEEFREFLKDELTNSGDLNPSDLTSCQEYLNKIVLDSKNQTDDGAIQRASKAITLLNYSNFNFAHQKYEGIKVPGANLSFVVFRSTNLDNADLSGCQLEGIQIREGSMRNTNLLGANFGKIDFIHQGHVHYRVNSVCYSPDGKKIASGGSSAMIKIWDVESGYAEHTILAYGGIIHTVAFSPNGKLLVSGDDQNNIQIWDTTKGYKLVKKIEKAHNRSVMCVAFAPDGKCFASGSYDGSIKIWDTETLNDTKTLSGGMSYVFDISFSADQKYMVSASCDGHTRIWDGNKFLLIKELSGSWGTHLHVGQISPDGSIILEAGTNNNITVFDTKSGEIIKKLENHESTVESISFSPDGSKFVSAGYDGQIIVWDTKSLNVIRQIPLNQGHINSVNFSPNGEYFISGGEENFIHIWNAKTFQKVKTMEGHRGLISAKTISQDGTLIASGSKIGEIKVWDIKSKKCIASFKGPHTKKQNFDEDNILSLSISEDNSIVAAAHNHGEISFWDIQKGTVINIVDKAHNRATAIAIFPDCERAVSGGEDKKLKVWDMWSGELIQTIDGHPNVIQCIHFEQGGKVFVSEDMHYYRACFDIQKKKLVDEYKVKDYYHDQLQYLPEKRLFVAADPEYVSNIEIYTFENDHLFDPMRIRRLDLSYCKMQGVKASEENIELFRKHQFVQL